MEIRGNTITIDAVDPEIKYRAVALLIKNEFRKMGFWKRGAFVEIVQRHNEKYSGADGVDLLQKFWLYRIIDREILEDLTQIINTLKITENEKNSTF